MEWRTHMLSGIAAGYAITGGDWRAGLVGGIAGVVPDLDQHKSKFGKIFFPLSYGINKIFGHRTITHSLLFAVLVGVLLSTFTEKWFWLAAVTGILAHITGDMLTGKVMIFYPVQKFIGFSVTMNTFTMLDRLTGLLLVIYIGKEVFQLL